MGTSTFATTWASIASDTTYVVGLVIATIVAAAIALMGLGYGFRHLKKYITGKRF